MDSARAAREQFLIDLNDTTLKVKNLSFNNENKFIFIQGENLITLLQAVESNSNDANFSIHIAQRGQNRQLFLQYSKVKKRLLNERKTIVGILNYIIGEHDDKN